MLMQFYIWISINKEYFLNVNLFLTHFLAQSVCKMCSQKLCFYDINIWILIQSFFISLFRSLQQCRRNKAASFNHSLLLMKNSCLHSHFYLLYLTWFFGQCVCIIRSDHRPWSHAKTSSRFMHLCLQIQLKNHSLGGLKNKILEKLFVLAFSISVYFWTNIPDNTKISDVAGIKQMS